MTLAPWHSLTTDATLTAVDSAQSGLSSAEAAKRFGRDGPNVLSERRGASWVRKLAELFLHPRRGAVGSCGTVNLSR